jgi:hypothetical protein
MTLLAFWIGVAALIGLDYAMRVWTGLPHRWVSHSIGSAIGAFVIAWGVWLVVGRFGGLRTSFDRRRYLLTIAMLLLAVSWFARRYGR